MTTTNIDLKYTKELVYVEEIKAPTATFSYIKFEEDKFDEEAFKQDKITLRNLKIGKLIHGEDNENNIKELENKIAQNEGINLNAIISPKIKTQCVTLNKFINTNDDLNIDKFISSEIIDELYKISSTNKNINNPNLDLNLSGCDIDISKRKLLSRILMASNLIATKTRIGPANVIIMHPKFIPFLNITSINNNKYSIGGINVITNEKAGNKFLIFRKTGDSKQISDNVIMVYNYSNEINELKYNIAQFESFESNYIEFDVNGLDI